MNRTRGQEDVDSRDQPAREVTFSIIDSPAGSGELVNANSTGTLLDIDDHGVNLLTRVRVEPGNIVRLDHGAGARVGIVMWSIESADQCRIQVRFI